MEIIQSGGFGMGELRIKKMRNKNKLKISFVKSENYDNAIYLVDVPTSRTTNILIKTFEKIGFEGVLYKLDLLEVVKSVYYNGYYYKRGEDIEGDYEYEKQLSVDQDYESVVIDGELYMVSHNITDEILDGLEEEEEFLNRLKRPGDAEAIISLDDDILTSSERRKLRMRGKWSAFEELRKRKEKKLETTTEE